jgi:ribose-phosphate pyrophosphokinase
MNLAVIILAAGKGTRMESDLPKVLHPLCDKPLVSWVLETALSLDPEQIVVVTGHQAEKVEATIRNQFGNTSIIQFTRQTEMNGTGHAVQQAAPLLEGFEGDVIVLCGDVPLIKPNTLRALMQKRGRRNAAAALLVAQIEEPASYGRVLVSEDGCVEKIVEAKDASPDVLAVRNVNAGTYCFDSVKLWPRLDELTADNAAGELYLTDVIGLLTRDGERVDAVFIEEREMTGVNTRHDLQQLETQLESEKKFSALPPQALTSHRPGKRADGRRPEEAHAIKIFSGNANPRLAHEVAAYLHRPIGRMTTTRFADGEIRVTIDESIRGADVFIIQPTCAPVNDTLMELLIMCDAFKRASARRVVPIVPYFGYARQDKKIRPREPITAKLVADLISHAGADRIFAMDLHAGQIQGIFACPVDHLPAFPIIAEYLVEHGLYNSGVTVVSPDVGGVTRAAILAERLGADLAIVAKKRPEPGRVAVIDVIGDVEGQTCVLLDDLVDSAGTFAAAANELAERGARAIYAAATHPVLSGDAIRRVQDSPIKELIVTDTIPIAPEKMIPKITVLSIAKVCAEAIWRIHTDDSVSTMFSSWEKLDM